MMVEAKAEKENIAKAKRDKARRLKMMTELHLISDKGSNCSQT